MNDTEMLENEKVYEYKSKLLTANDTGELKIAVFGDHIWN